MAIVADDLVAMSRGHLTEQDASTKFDDARLHALVTPAIAEWVRQMLADSAKRKNFQAETGTINIAAGVADAGAALGAAGIQSQFVKDADILIDYDGIPVMPVQFVQSHSRFIAGGITDKHFINTYFDGTRFYFRTGDGAIGAMTGTFKVRGVSVPTTAAAIPSSSIGEIATILAGLARKYNTDGANVGVSINAQKV